MNEELATEVVVKVEQANCKTCGGTGLVQYTMWSRESGDKLVEGQWTCEDCAPPVDTACPGMKAG